MTIWAIFDVVLTLFLVAHFSSVSVFNVQALHFNISTSGFDLWIVSLVRSASLLGFTLGKAISKNKEKSSRKLSKLSPIVATSVVLLLIYPIVKLLICEEYDEKGKLIFHPTPTPTVETVTSSNSSSTSSSSPHHPWIWGLIGWSELANCIYAFCYCILAFKMKGTREAKRYKEMRINNINADIDEEEVSNSSDDSTDSDSSSSSSSLSPLLTKQTKRKEKKEAKRGATVLRLLQLSRPDIHIILSGFFFLGVAAAADTIQPYYYGKVIDTIAIRRDESEFVQAIVVICVLAGTASIGSGLRGMLFLISMARVNIRVRNRLFGAVTRQEIGFFDTNRTGDVTSRLTSDTTKLSDQISLNMNIFLRSLARAIGSLIFMFKLSWKLSIVVLLGIPLIALITYYYGKYYKVTSET